MCFQWCVRVCVCVCVCVCVFVSPVSNRGLGLAGRCMALDGAAGGSNSTAVSSLFPSQVSLPSLTYLASCAIVCIFLVCHDFFWRSLPPLLTSPVAVLLSGEKWRVRCGARSVMASS